MKSTGGVRKVDELGRIAIPESRWTLNINIKDPMKIFLDGDCIILNKKVAYY
jgi:transcriptional pleiotropic regulator of transition state genes